MEESTFPHKGGKEKENPVSFVRWKEKEDTFALQGGRIMTVPSFLRKGAGEILEQYCSVIVG